MLKASGRRGLLAFIAVTVLLMTGCGDDNDPNRYVARVDDRYLLQEDVERQLGALPVASDSAVARLQIVERWVTNELLYQEAQRRGLQNDDEVERLLEESQRTILVNALLEKLYDENAVEPSEAELQAYYERHKDQLGLRESFVRVRYLETTDRAGAAAARQAIQDAAIEQRDSVWTAAINRNATDAEACKEISQDYFPESRIFAGRGSVRRVLGELAVGEVSPVIETDSSFVVIQLAERVAPQTIPQPQWIEDELARRVVIQGRKQLYARQVQRLRNEALAREELDVR